MNKKDLDIAYGVGESDQDNEPSREGFIKRLGDNKGAAIGLVALVGLGAIGGLASQNSDLKQQLEATQQELKVSDAQLVSAEFDYKQQAALNLLSDPSTTSETVDAYAKFHDPQVALAVLSHENSTSSAVEEVAGARMYNDQVSLAVINHEETTPEAIEMVTPRALSNKEVLLAVANHPLASSDALMDVAMELTSGSYDIATHEALKVHPNTSPMDLEEIDHHLAHHARHGKTPEDLEKPIPCEDMSAKYQSMCFKDRAESAGQSIEVAQVSVPEGFSGVELDMDAFNNRLNGMQGAKLEVESAAPSTGMAGPK